MKKISWLGWCGALVLSGVAAGACDNGTSTPDGGGEGGASGGSSSGGRPATGGVGGTPATGGAGGAPPAPPSCDEIDPVGFGGAFGGGPGFGGQAALGGDTGFGISSPAFDFCEPIPAEYTCDDKEFAEGISPELSWGNGPEGTQSYAIVFKDLTLAGIPDPVAYDHAFHWVIWDIPTDVHSLPEALDDGETPVSGTSARQWAPFNNYRFMGPCPNPFALGGVQVPEAERANDSYAFVLYALSEETIPVPAATATKSFVTVLDEWLRESAIAATEYRGTSNAASITEPPTAGPPATPSPAVPCPTDGSDEPDDCLEAP